MADTTRPSNQLEWAKSYLIDGVSGIPNREAPTEESTISGLNRGEPLDRQLYNYHIWALSAWQRYFDKLTQVNNVIQTTDNTVTTTSLATDLGGLWASIGTTTVGSDTVYWFKRI